MAITCIQRISGHRVPAALLMVLTLLSGCAGGDGTGSASGVAPSLGSPPQRIAGRESPELRADAPPAEASQEENLAGLPVLPQMVGLFRGLVAKPVMQPVSSLRRLVFFATDTTYDLLKPVSIFGPGDAPVPPLATGPSMDLDAWERRLDELTGTTPSTGTIRFLIDGDEFFPALAQSVRGARHSINFRTYVFDNDDYATAFADLLKRRSKEVDVRVLVDGLGTRLAAGVTPETMPPGFAQPESILRYLRRRSDVAVRVQSNPWLAGDHSKTFIIDRRVAFVGGMNVGREYRYEWHDLMMEVRGPVVGVIDRDFHKAWSHAGLLGDLGYLAYQLRPRGRIESGDGHPVRVLYTKPHDSQIYRAQLAAIRTAQRYIYIENPYFSDNEMLAELIRARRRGVDVRVILPSRNDSSVMDYGNVVSANAMFRNGIRVFLHPGFTHVKAAIFDGWACVGSANLDKMSLRVNEELNLATSHRATVDALRRRLFEPDFARSREIDAPLQENLTHRLAAFLADQL